MVYTRLFYFGITVKIADLPSVISWVQSPTSTICRDRHWKKQMAVQTPGSAIVPKNGENLKILIEIFRLKYKVSNVILAFLDHLKPKTFFVGQPWWPTSSAPSFQNFWIRPWHHLFTSLSCTRFISVLKFRRLH